MPCYYWYHNKQSYGNNFASPGPGLDWNSKNIADFFIRQRGWSLTAVAGLLGNVARESGMNPSRLQHKSGQPDYDYPPGGYPTSFDGPVTPEWTWTFARSPEQYRDRILGWGLIQWTSGSGQGQPPLGINWIINQLHYYLGQSVTRRSYFDAYMATAYHTAYAPHIAVWSGFGILDYELLRLQVESDENYNWSMTRASNFLHRSMSFTEYARTGESAYNCGVLFGICRCKSAAINKAIAAGQVDGGESGRQRGRDAEEAYNWLIRNGYGSPSTYPVISHSDDYYGMYGGSQPGPGPTPPPQPVGTNTVYITVDRDIPERIQSDFENLEFEITLPDDFDFIEVGRARGSIGFYNIPDGVFNFQIHYPQGLHLVRLEQIQPQPQSQQYEYKWIYHFSWSNIIVLKNRLPIWYNGKGLWW